MRLSGPEEPKIIASVGLASEPRQPVSEGPVLAGFQI